MKYMLMIYNNPAVIASYLRAARATNSIPEKRYLETNAARLQADQAPR